MFGMTDHGGQCVDSGRQWVNGSVHMSHLRFSAGYIVYLHIHVTVPGMLHLGNVDVIPISRELQCLWYFVFTFSSRVHRVCYYAVSYVVLYFIGSTPSLSHPHSECSTCVTYAKFVSNPNHCVTISCVIVLTQDILYLCVTIEVYLCDQSYFVL